MPLISLYLAKCGSPFDRENSGSRAVLFVLFVAQTMSVSSTAIMVFAGVMDSQPEPEEAVFVLGCKVSDIQDTVHAIFLVWDTVEILISSHFVHTDRHTDKRTH